MFIYPIVGAYYRKPAQAILDCLVLDQKLYIRAEPDNKFDPNAVMVVGKRAEFMEPMNDDARFILQSKVERFGIEWDLFMDCNEFHLGYIPRDTAPVELHENLRAKGDIECVFKPDMAGKPTVTIY